MSAFQVLALDISLRPEQITVLAQRITLTIESLTDIDTIIDATRNDLALAQQLKGACCAPGFFVLVTIWHVSLIQVNQVNFTEQHHVKQ